MKEYKSSMIEKTKKYTNTKKAKRIKLKWSLLNKLFFMLILSISVYYVACTNDLTVKGFVVQDLKMKLSDLEESSKKLELEAYDLKNTKNISLRAQAMKMVKVERIDYITVASGEVAKK